MAFSSRHPFLTYYFLTITLLLQRALTNNQFSPNRPSPIVTSVGPFASGRPPVASKRPTSTRKAPRCNPDKDQFESPLLQITTICRVQRIKHIQLSIRRRLDPIDQANLILIVLSEIVDALLNSNVKVRDHAIITMTQLILIDENEITRQLKCNRRQKLHNEGIYSTLLTQQKAASLQ